MRNRFIFITALLIGSLALADAVIFSGNDVLSLKPSLDLFRTAKVMGVAANPTVTSTPAPPASLALDYTQGQVYYKSGPAGTDWVSISDAVTGPPNYYAGYNSQGVMSEIDGITFQNDSSAFIGSNINPAVSISATGIVGVTSRIDLNGQNIGDYDAFSNSAYLGASTPTTINSLRGFMNNPIIDIFAEINNYYPFYDNTALNGSVDQYYGISIAPYMTSGASNLVGASVRPFTQSGSIAILGNFTGVDISPVFNSGSELQNYRSMTLSDYIGESVTIPSATWIQMNHHVDSDVNSVRGIAYNQNFGQSHGVNINNMIDLQISPHFYSGSSISSYDGAIIAPDFDDGSILGNMTGIRVSPQLDANEINSFTGFSGGVQIAGGPGVVSIGNYQDMNLNANIGATAQIENFSGIIVRPNVQSGAQVTNSLTMMDIGINSDIPVAGNAVGIRVDMGNVVSPNQVYGLNVNGAAGLSSTIDTADFTPTPFGTSNNYIGGTLHVSPGFPLLASPGFGNNLGITMYGEDDVTADNFLGAASVGQSVNGFVNQVIVTSGKTWDTINYMFAGGSFPPQSTGGTLENVSFFRAAGLIPGGGALTINNEVLFHGEETAELGNPTNLWGIRIDGYRTNNWFGKNLVIGGSTMLPSAASVALEIATTSGGYLPPRLTSTERDALTPLDGMQIHNLTTGRPEYYSGSSWVPFYVSGGTGTVTEVAVTLPSIFSVTGSPVTVSGTIAATLANQSANTVFAGPVTGASASPTFRALVGNDIPSISLASGVNGTLSAVSGGTGLNTYTTGDTLYSSATNTLSKLAVGVSGQVLTVSSAGVPYWSNVTATTLSPGVVSVSTNYTVTSALPNVYVDTGGTARTITMPSASSYPNQIFAIMKADSQPAVVSVTGGLTATLGYSEEALVVQSVSGAYKTLSRYHPPVTVVYQSGAGVSWTTTAGFNFSQKVVDTGCNGNCVTTGSSWLMTIPYSGFYAGHFQVNQNTAPVQVQVYVNGSNSGLACYYTSASQPTTCSFNYYFNKGDTIGVRLGSSSGSSQGLNVFSIHSVN